LKWIKKVVPFFLLLQHLPLRTK